MAAKGYTTATLVAQEMGRDLTAPQLDQCADLIEAAEAFIDQQTGRSWLATSPTTAELHQPDGPVVYLKHRPVAAISSVSVRPLVVGGTDTVLVANTDYELIDATNGVLLINSLLGVTGDIVRSTLARGSLLKVTYTTVTPVPANVQRLTTELVANWLTRRIGGSNMAGVKSFKMPDFSIDYTDAGSSFSVPDDLMRRINALERVMFA
jgi:hypothetical protein